MDVGPEIVVGSSLRDKVTLRKRPKTKSRRFEGNLHRPKSMAVLDIIIKPKSQLNHGSKTTPLIDVLHKKKSRVDFQNFLSSEYSAENLHFWRACESYRKSRSKKSDRLNLARDIYDTYVSPNALSEVNIPHATKKRILLSLMAEELPKNLFEAAQKHIFNIMENDSYSRFLLSPYHKRSGSKSPMRWGRRSPSPTP